LAKPPATLIQTQSQRRIAVKDSSEVFDVLVPNQEKIVQAETIPEPTLEEQPVATKEQTEVRKGTCIGKSEIEFIVERVAAFIEKLVFLKVPSLYQLLALWTIATHMRSDFDYMGYMFACSPEPQSGKSRLLEVLQLLVANPSDILISPSEAVLFRTAEGHTQLLDEVDGWTNRDVLRNVLNAGFHRGATVQRMNEGDGVYEVNKFPVYAPRVLAGIGHSVLHGTTRDRTFVLDMVRQTREERRERFSIRKVKSAADEIKISIEKWVGQHRAEIGVVYDQFPFDYLQDFRDRTIDVAQPLAAVLEVAYKDNPEYEDAKSEFLEAISVTRKEEQPLTDDHRVLRTLVELAKAEDPLVGSVTELASKCQELLGERPEEFALSSTLRRYGFETKSIRREGKAAYRYSLPHGSLSDLMTRYCGPTHEEPVPTVPESEAESSAPVVGVVIEQGG
jgi:hypothetical protein